MIKHKKTRLIFKLLLVILPLLVLSIIITSVTLSWTSHKYFQKTIVQDYKYIIKSSAGEIRLYMKQARKGLEGLSLMMAATKLDTYQKEMALSAFIHTSAEFMSISLVSTEGAGIASTGREGESISFGQDEMFKRALLGKSAISDVMMTKDRIPFVHLAVPVKHLGVVTEVLWGELDLKSVWDVLDGIRVGHTGHVSIMDLSGRLIGHREIDQVVKTLSPEKPEILNKLRDSDTPIKWIRETGDTHLFCLGYHIPELNWIIVLSQVHQEIYAYLYKDIFWAVSITCIICIVAILICWNQVKIFLTPIHRLHRQVQRIGQGELDEKVSVDSQDEIGDLGLAFNEMTDSLNKYITRLREEHEQRKLLSKELISILEKERHRVAMELHDHIGQSLTVLKMDLEEAQLMLKSPDAQLDGRISAAKEKAIQTINDVRDIAYGLRPSMLDTTGLISSLRALCDDVEQTKNIEINFFSQNVQERMEREIEISVYRIVQESLNNIMKHARAKKVYLNLVLRDGTLSLSIEDDGVGFESNMTIGAPGKKRSLGLNIMKERVVQLGGDFTLESRVGGGGTLLMAEIPI